MLTPRDMYALACVLHGSGYFPLQELLHSQSLKLCHKQVPSLISALSSNALPSVKPNRAADFKDFWTSGWRASKFPRKLGRVKGAGWFSRLGFLRTWGLWTQKGTILKARFQYISVCLKVPRGDAWTEGFGWLTP